MTLPSFAETVKLNAKAIKKTALIKIYFKKHRLKLILISSSTSTFLVSSLTS